MPTMIIGLLAALTMSTPVAAESRQQTVLAAQLQWLTGYNHRDEKTLAIIEADDFRVVIGDGRVQSKADQLVKIRKAPPKGATYEIAVESTEVRLYGNTAVLTGIVVEKGTVPHACMPFLSRSRYTDTWILRSGRWQVVSSHLSELKE